MAQRSYTEDERAVALAYFEACGQNQNKTSRDCKIPLATLQGWIKGKGINHAVTAKTVDKRPTSPTCLSANSAPPSPPQKANAKKPPTNN